LEKKRSPPQNGWTGGGEKNEKKTETKREPHHREQEGEKSQYLKKISEHPAELPVPKKKKGRGGSAAGKGPRGIRARTPQGS